MAVVLIFKEHCIKMRILVQKKLKGSSKEFIFADSIEIKKTNNMKGPKQISIIYQKLFEYAQKDVWQQGKL